MDARRVHAGPVPLWIFEPEGPPRGTVLVYHGLFASKDGQGKELASLARRGLRAVGVDAVGHGERHDPDMGALLEREGARPMLDLVGRTVDEIPRLLDELRGGEPFGITGISMGAYVAFGALMTDPRLRVGVPILGSPDWRRIGGQRLPLEAFAEKRILAMNAGRDGNVPAEGSRIFLAELRGRYGEGFEYVEYAESEHFMRPGDWEDLWARTEDWLLRWL
jgi:pimeloyl-ACP methyl ester carboxylesterase